MPSYRIQTVFTGVPGTPWLSTMYLDAGDAGSASGAADAVADFWNAVDQDMANTIGWNIDTNVALFTNPETLTGWEVISSRTGFGGNSTNPLPWATQGLLRWNTATVFNNRRVRGRTFLPGFTEGDNTTGIPSSGLLTRVNAAAAALPGTGLQVASRAMNSFVPVTGGAMWSQWAVLRSRRD